MSQSPEEPRSIKEAISSPEKLQWEKAMEAEMKSLKENEVWDLVELPKGRKAIGSKWVSRSKLGQMAQLNITKPDWWLKVFRKNTVMIMTKHFVR